ncbi:MAG TPA: Tex family protein, partial [Desulfobacterales bacterium]|nr:Tex family protein [Desulfobacterales bacterium]
MGLHHVTAIARELSLQEDQVAAVASLLAAEATVPFIARYRKEATGSLDEVAVTAVRDRLQQLAELDLRRVAVLKSLEQHGHLTEELRQRVEAVESLAALEDLYLPYRPKRRTRAMIAREKGLEPLARLLLEQAGTDPTTAAQGYVNPEAGVPAAEDALAGARDIIAEIVNEDATARSLLREFFGRKAVIASRVAAGAEATGAKYRDYFEWQEPAASAPSHRILAIRRGEAEDVLNLTVLPPEPDALALLEGTFVRGDGEDAAQVRAAVHDGYRRLLGRALETELRVALKERADQEAIRVFAANLRELLLAPPLGRKRVLAVDPGFRTGCKAVCLDEQGQLLHHDTLFPHGSERQAEEAARKALDMAARFGSEIVAVGSGTAGRETEQFFRAISFPTPIPVVRVDESGASIYSASEVAREEFGELDLTVRGAVSIGRRLMDPLAELVKLDPKSIGVGQYQHDVDQAALRRSLDDVVVSCVNSVGVDLNQASKELLTYVSGLGPQLARNIVAHRNANGPFRSRSQLREVPRLGPKAFEQCAGFLRIRDGDHPLDASAVHPESYPVVEAMASDLGCAIGDLLSDPGLRARIELPRYAGPAVGLPTLQDILQELAKPGRDPRLGFELFAFAQGVNELKDLVPGMRLPGVVTNVTAFGAFVDIGVHQDGLVHVSELSDRFVRSPMDVVKVHQKVEVRVLSVDSERKRIALSMRRADGPAPPQRGAAATAPPRTAPA